MVVLSYYRHGTAGSGGYVGGNGGDYSLSGG